MQPERLSAHYTKKYLSESEKKVTTVYPDTPYPVNRYEAAVHFLKQHFHGGSVLELGVGNGIILNSLIHSGLPFEEYVASDVSEPRLDGIRNTIHDGRVKVLLLDAEAATDGQEGKYDAIVMVALIEHLIDPMGAMQRIRQMLKPGGFVYIDTPNIAKYTRRVKLAFGNFPSTASKNEGLTTYLGDEVDMFDEGHLHYFTYRSLSLMLTQRCGFARVEKFGYFHGRQMFGKRLCRLAARGWPEMFSDLAINAYV